MEFTYKSVTGNITIDVSEDWIAILRECDREEYNNDHTETRRHYHLGSITYEGSELGVEDEALERLLESDAARSILDPALRKLTPTQRNMIEALFYKGMTAKEYAISRGITPQAAFDIKQAALKKLKKILKYA